MTRPYRQRQVRPVEERFWEKVEKTAGCWLYRGPIKENGYGVINVGRRGDGYRYAHRFAWEMEHSSIPYGLHVCHRCDVRNCVRSDHLFLGTQAENLADMHAKGRQAKPEQTRHVGEANGRAVLTADQARDIREWHAAGVNSAALARFYGVGDTTVRNIISGYRWAAA